MHFFVQLTFYFCHQVTFEKSNPYPGSTHTQFFSCFINKILQMHFVVQLTCTSESFYFCHQGTFEKSNPYLGSTHTQFFSCFIINSFITEANVVEYSGSYQLQIRKKLNLFGGNAQNFVVAKHDFLHVSRGAYLPCTPVFHLFLY